MDEYEKRLLVEVLVELSQHNHDAIGLREGEFFYDSVRLPGWLVAATYKGLVYTDHDASLGERAA